MRTANSVDSKVVHPVAREMGSKDQAIEGMHGTGRSFHHCQEAGPLSRGGKRLAILNFS